LAFKALFSYMVSSYKKTCNEEDWLFK